MWKKENINKSKAVGVSTDRLSKGPCRAVLGRCWQYRGVSAPGGYNSVSEPLRSFTMSIKWTAQTEWDQVYSKERRERSESRLIVSDSFRPYGLYNPWNSPGQSTGEGILSLLQGIVPTQWSNPGILHCRGILYQLSHKGRREVGFKKRPKTEKEKLLTIWFQPWCHRLVVKLPSKYSHHHFPGAVSNLGLRAPEIQDTACPHNGVFLHWKLMILPVTLPVFFFCPSDICLLLKIKINVKVRTSFSLLLK